MSPLFHLSIIHRTTIINFPVRRSFQSSHGSKYFYRIVGGGGAGEGRPGKTFPSKEEFFCWVLEMATKYRI
jgi:hypothetical protein